MKLTVRNLDNEEVGDIELADEVFGLPVRRDILARVVNWQLAKRRAGTHKTKGISEIQRDDQEALQAEGHRAAPARAACARRSSAAARVFSGRWCAATHSTLQKKVRELGLKTALSAKQAEGKLIVIDAARVDEAKTKALRARFDSARLGFGADHRRRRRSTRISPAPRATCRGSTCCRSRAPMSTTSCAATRWS